jgi:hypothetical protein
MSKNKYNRNSKKYYIRATFIVVLMIIMIVLIWGGLTNWWRKSGPSGPSGPPGPSCGTSKSHDGAPSSPEPDSSVDTQQGTSGNGQATTTYFSGTESVGAGACGGCGASNGYGNKYNFACMTNELLNAIPGQIWLGTAPAESMAGKYANNKNYTCGTGSDAKSDPNTASAPCGSSFELTFPNGKTVNIVVVDACPYVNNQQWCPQKPGQTNSLNSYNHFDIWVGNSEKLIANKLGLSDITAITSSNDSKPRTFKPINTPPEIIKVLQQYCCNAYWPGQGCKNICGSNFEIPSS